MRSAILYARTRLPVEQVALRFHSAGLLLPLKHYLSDVIDRADDSASTAQLSLLCAWLTQVYAALLASSASTEADGSSEGSPAALEAELVAFLADKQRLGCLEPSTTHKLLGGAGEASRRLLLHYASLCGDWRRVVGLHLGRGELAAAFEVLQSWAHGGGASSGSSQEAHLQLARTLEAHADELLEANPTLTVDLMLKALPHIETERLLPSLMRYHQQKCAAATGGVSSSTSSGSKGGGGGSSSVHEGIRLLSRCPPSAATTDALTLFHAAYSDSRALFSYLTTAEVRCFDAEYALRVCTDYKREEACVLLLKRRGSFEQAARYAIRAGMPDLAKQVLSEGHLEGDAARKLWLEVTSSSSSGGVGGAGSSSNGSGVGGGGLMTSKLTVHEVMAALAEGPPELRLEHLLPRLDTHTVAMDLKELVS